MTRDIIRNKTKHFFHVLHNFV